MNSKPKILVFRMREIIYTFLLVLLVILLLICLFLMFSPNHFSGGRQPETTDQLMTGQSETMQNTPGQSEMIQQITDRAQTDPSQTDTTVQTSAAASSSMSFTPGVYTVPVFLNDATVDVEVTVDADRINSIRLVNLSETIQTMYPLMSPSLENITSQILQRQTLDNITCPQENRYTSQLLMNAISDALDKAQKQ